MKALVSILIVAAWVSPLIAQDTTRFAADSANASDTPRSADSATSPDSHPYRSPRRALILGSLIPGAGHIYAGEYWRGIGNYEFTVMSIGMGAMVFILDDCAFSFLSATRCDSGPQWPHQALGVAAVGVGLWRWVSSARDAPHAAERANEKHRRKMLQAKPIIQAPLGARGDWRAGVMIPW
jgi:hypothetical protein